MTKKMVEDVHLTYEQVKPHDEEYARALKIAVYGGDPAYQMSPAARDTFRALRAQRRPALDGDVRSIKENITHLIESLGSTLSLREIHDACGITVSAAFFLKRETITPLERMRLAQQLLSLLSAMRKSVADAATEESLEALHRNTQTLVVEDPESDGFKTGLDNIIHLKDYLDTRILE